MKKIIRIGLVGSGLMGRAHVSALKILKSHLGVIVPEVHLEIVAGSTPERASSAAVRFGCERWTASWEELVTSPSIDAVDIVAPNYLHARVAIAACEAGKHVFCEKPLALNGDEARRMAETAKRMDVVHAVGFNYRRSPGVQFACHLLRSGRLGEIRHFRGWYLQDFAADASVPFSWRFQADRAGSGALGGIGSHIIDIARWLCGEITEVLGEAKTWMSRRILARAADTFSRSLSHAPGEIQDEYSDVTVEDWAAFLCRFNEGATGTFEVSRCAQGHKNDLGFEATAKHGAVRFAYERPGELEVYLGEDSEEVRAFRRILLGPAHPDGDRLWPLPGMGVGFTETVALELADFVNSISQGSQMKPDFFDGWLVNEVIDAVLRSTERRRWERVRTASEVLNG